MPWSIMIWCAISYCTMLCYDLSVCRNGGMTSTPWVGKQLRLFSGEKPGSAMPSQKTNTSFFLRTIQGRFEQKQCSCKRSFFSQKLSVEKSLMEISQKCQDRAIKAELRAAAAEAATWLSFFGFTPFFWGGIVFDICIYSCIRCCTVLLKK